MPNQGKAPTRQTGSDPTKEDRLKPPARVPARGGAGKAQPLHSRQEGDATAKSHDLGHEEVPSDGGGTRRQPATRNTTRRKERYRKVTMNVLEESYDLFGQSAEMRGVSLSEAMRQALALWMIAVDPETAGVAINRKDGTRRDLLLI